MTERRRGGDADLSVLILSKLLYRAPSVQRLSAALSDARVRRKSREVNSCVFFVDRVMRRLLLDCFVDLLRMIS